ALEADPEHDAVDYGDAVGEVLDRRERDLVPERDRAHHLAARLVRRQAKGFAALDRDLEVGAERGRDAAALLPCECRDGVLRPLRGALEVLERQAPLAHSGLDRRDLPVRLAGLANGAYVREAVRLLVVGDDY